jgi:hypothetical protein
MNSGFSCDWYLEDYLIPHTLPPQGLNIFYHRVVNKEGRKEGRKEERKEGRKEEYYANHLYFFTVGISLW